jgi:hypothetical protein
LFRPHAFAPKFFGIPTIKITQQALTDMWHLVQVVQTQEVGWLVVTHEQPDGSFILSEVVLPGQNCHAATTELTEEGLAEVCMKLMQEDQEKGIGPDDQRFRANHLNCWVHSHVQMAVQPSTQDDKQMEEFCQMYEDDHEVWIRGIMNQKGDAEFTVYYKCGKSGTWRPIKDCPWEVIEEPDPDRRKLWEGLVSERIKKVVHQPAYTGGTYNGRYSGYSGAPRYGQRGYGQTQTKGRVITPADNRWNGGRVGKGPKGGRA